MIGNIAMRGRRGVRDGRPLWPKHDLVLDEIRGPAQAQGSTNGTSSIAAGGRRRDRPL
jgi:hypothetical protein